MMKVKKIRYCLLFTGLLSSVVAGCWVTPVSESADTISAVSAGNNFIKLNPDTIAYPGEAKSYRWNYEQGLILDAFYRLWKLTGDDNYFKYIKKNIDYYVTPQGEILTYKQSDYNIDNISSGRVLLNLYSETKEERYKKAADALMEQLKSHPRTPSGGFWHKKVYPNQMWLDGLYMAQPFYARYTSEFGNKADFDDIIKQFELIAKNLKDEKTGLYFHAWDESREQKWADSLSGRSPNFWGRSMGWYMMAMVDVLDYIPKDHPRREYLISIFRDLSASLLNYRDSKTGLWYQVTDKGEKKGNYIETSASLMHIYSFAKGYRNGYLSPEYKRTATDCFNSLTQNFIVTNEEGNLFLKNTVSVGGLGGKPYRDGSFEYYISEPIRENDFKGYGPLILAAVELALINR